MLKKLVGVLLFSKAASAVVDPNSVNPNDINKDNYKKSLCNDDLFRPTPMPIFTCGNYESMGYNCAHEVPIINTHYNNYCREKSNYEMAIQEKGRQCEEDNNTYPCAGNGEEMMTRDECIDKHGVRLSKACMILKRDRMNDNPWNHVVPTLESCSSKKLKFK